ncbi:helix-turn-helix domain-containing protein [Polaribacter atrinae]|uniref:helix-turn-helix domain-containing protein n=1 Tax=Polaribacter atrinae TaxID=1333662 RepID=UPI0030F52CC5
MEFIQNEITEIKELLLALDIQQKERLTVKEASAYLQLSKSCLYKMTSNKEIPFYIPGGKIIYFKKSELDDWVFRNRTPSNYEIELELENNLFKPLNN